MGIVRTSDRRRENRSEADLAVTIWGIDTRGEKFLQHAHAREISLSGALLTGLEAELRSGDVLGLIYSGKKARYRVVWIRHGADRKMQAAVVRVEADVCPWQQLLAEQPVAEARSEDSQTL